MFKLVDNVLVYGDTIKDLENRIDQLLKRCYEYNITLGDGKVQAGTEVQFGVYVVKDYGYKSDPSKVWVSQDYPEPKDLTNLRSFVGLVNQFNDFSPDLKHAMEPPQIKQ